MTAFANLWRTKISPNLNRHANTISIKQIFSIADNVPLIYTGRSLKSIIRETKRNMANFNCLASNYYLPQCKAHQSVSAYDRSLLVEKPHSILNSVYSRDRF